MCCVIITLNIKLRVQTKGNWNEICQCAFVLFVCVCVCMCFWLCSLTCNEENFQLKEKGDRTIYTDHELWAINYEVIEVEKPNMIWLYYDTKRIYEFTMERSLLNSHSNFNWLISHSSFGNGHISKRERWKNKNKQTLTIHAKIFHSKSNDQWRMIAH